MIQFRMQPSNYYAEVFGAVAVVEIGMYFVILCITTRAAATAEALMFQCVRGLNFFIKM